MSILAIIGLTLKASLIITVFAFGLLAIPKDLVSVLRQPWLLARSLFATFVVMLAVALAIVFALRPPQVIVAVIIALALSPIPPFLPLKQIKAGGETAYAIGLMVACSLFALVWIPLADRLLEAVLDVDVLLPFGKVATALVTVILAPLAAGAVIRRFVPDLAIRFQPLVLKIGLGLLVVACLPIIVKLWGPTMALVGDGAVIAFLIFILAGLAAGFALGGPEPEHRTDLALATATRHPGIAIALASVNLAGDKTVAPAVLLYLLVATIAGIPFVAWRKRTGAAKPVATA